MSTRKAFDHGDREMRLRRAYERLGTDDPSCILCDNRNPFAIELHHAGGRKFCNELVPLCLNHHARASDLAKDHPVKVDCCISPLEGYGHLLLGLGDLAEIAADELRDPMLANILMYQRLKLKEVGLILIEIARRAPMDDFGLPK